MTRGGKGKKRAFRLKDRTPSDPAIHRMAEWPGENRGFYAAFRHWLADTGYSPVSVSLYCVGARQALGYLNQHYWTIDPDADIARAWQFLNGRKISPLTRIDYHKGVAKLAEYLRLRQDKPPSPKAIRWEYYLDTLPEWLVADVRSFLLHCARRWKSDQLHPLTLGMLGSLSRGLRWFQSQAPIEQAADLTPERWYAYLDFRLEEGISPKTLNIELKYLQQFLNFLEEGGTTICQRLLRVGRLPQSRNLPRDVPAEQLARLQQVILTEGEDGNLPAWRQRMGKMDLAWFLLMLHCGLRTREVRVLKLADIDWDGQRVRIEQSKGLKDRMVFLSQAVVGALQAYLQVRGPVDILPENLFVYRHAPLSNSYCSQRLHTYGRRCGVYATPHMLRHSCATLLLNSGAPVLTVQMLLGHKWVDTTLGYARLYDGTVAAGYYRAMADVERRLALPEDRLEQPPALGQLLAMVDALHSGTLNAEQVELVRLLRSGLAAMAEKEF